VNHTSSLLSRVVLPIRKHRYIYVTTDQRRDALDLIG
jgi:hypothetical protein